MRSTATDVPWSVCLYYKYITQFAGEIIFKIGEHYKVRGKMFDCVDTPGLSWTFVLKDAALATRQKSKLTRV